MIVAVVLIVLALVYYLVLTIVAAAEDHEGTRCRDRGRGRDRREERAGERDRDLINEQLDAGVDLLEGLLVKKAGLMDAVGLVDGLYPGAPRRACATSRRART